MCVHERIACHFRTGVRSQRLGHTLVQCQNVVNYFNESLTGGTCFDPRLCQEPFVICIIPTRSVWPREVMRPTLCSPRVCARVLRAIQHMPGRVCRELCFWEHPGFEYTRNQPPSCRNVKHKSILGRVCRELPSWKHQNPKYTNKFRCREDKVEAMCDYIAMVLSR